MLKLDIFTRLGLKVITRSASSKHQTSKKILLELRNKTGYPLINCRQALQANNYNIEKAEQSLIESAKEKGWDKMNNLSNQMSEGLISVLSNKNTAVIVEVNCQTDFVAKTTDFQKVVKEIAQTTLNKYSKMEPGKIELNGDDILEFKSHGNAGTLKDSVAMTIGKLRESIAIRRASVLSVSPAQNLSVYVHPSLLIKTATPQISLGSYAAVVAITSLDESSTSSFLKLKGRELAQHCVGMKPSIIGTPPESVLVQPEVEDKETAEVASSTDDITSSNVPEIDPNSKNDELSESASPGGDESFEILPPDEASDELLKQPFLLEGEISVAHWLNYYSIKVDDFVRYRVGEKLDD